MVPALRIASSAVGVIDDNAGHDAAREASVSRWRPRPALREALTAQDRARAVAVKRWFVIRGVGRSVGRSVGPPCCASH